MSVNTTEIPRGIAILGSTGSIGTQTLDIFRRYPGRYRPVVLTANTNVDLLARQALEFRPDLVVIADTSRYTDLCRRLEGSGIAVAAGADAIADAMERPNFDMVVTATVGYSGLLPTVRAIRAGKDIALANKETLVVAGELITRLLGDSASEVYPVDSEHSAVYQCLRGHDSASVRRIILTASGGPFRTWEASRIDAATAEDALRHPNWNMGAKITVDSASMLNKVFEIIEARWLFGVRPDQVSAVVHPQSIVHSMVEFEDGAIMAQLGVPDMELPIAYALEHGHRVADVSRPLTLERMSSLTFEEPDPVRFPCLTLARPVMERGGNMACVVNAANEIAVAAFLRGEIAFGRIYPVIIETLGRVPFVETPTLEDYVESNTMARRCASEVLKILSL